MRGRRFRGTKQRTAWHPLYVRAIRFTLPRGAFSVRGELQLTEQPLRLDLLVVRRKLVAAPPDLPLRTARLFYEADETIVELKGPSHLLCGTDYQALWTYAYEYGRQRDLGAPGRLQLILVASRLSDGFRRRAEAYQSCFEAVEPGLWRLGGQAHRVYVIETEVVADPALRFFSKQLVRQPRDVFNGLTSDDQRRLLVDLLGEVRQLRRHSLANMSYIDFQELNMTTEEMLECIVRDLPPEDRLRGLKPEERLRGLKPEELLRGLKPEELEKLRALLDAMPR